MKKVLILSYYWLPSGKASLHWPLGLVRYLPENGWEPVILTVENESFTEKDSGLTADQDLSVRVERTAAFEPFNLYKKFTGRKKDDQLVPSELISRTNKKLTHRIALWIRMNLFVPDARIGWYFGALKGGADLLNKEKFDAVVSIGPPHSIHLPAMKLSRRHSLPHIPVFIDPWVDIVYYKGFKRNPFALKADNYLEEKVLRNSAGAVFITDTMKQDYIKKYPFLSDKSSVLYWGYDEKYFSGKEHTTRSDEEVILHTGNIFDYQNIPGFWKLIREKINSGRKLKLVFTGSVSPEIKQSLKENNLLPYTEIKGFLPYNEVIDEMFNADFLLVCATEKRHMPGKIFEYLRTGKPVIAFGDDNEEVADILLKSGAGMLFSYSGDGKYVLDHPEEFKADPETVKQYDRRTITRLMSEILNRIINKQV